MAWRYDIHRQSDDVKFNDLIYTGGVMTDEEVENFPWTIIGYNDIDQHHIQTEDDALQ